VGVSVALCTYNGEAFLSAQLASIVSQTQPPDEVVICDDRSTDSTQRLLAEFSASAPFPVTIQVNTLNLGVAKNFAEAISRCSHEHIALSDQDDVWQPQRLERLSATLDQNPQAAFVFSNARVVDASQGSCGYTLWDAYSVPKSIRGRNASLYDSVLKRPVVTGATMMFRRRFVPLLLPIGDGWLHDEWITLLLLMVSDGLGVDELLIDYRRHHNQLVGAKINGLVQQFVTARRISSSVREAQVRRLSEALVRIESQTAFRAKDDRKEKLLEALEHWKMRASARQRSWFTRTFVVISEVLSGGYGKYALGWKSAAADLFL
jgi:glycosyltransferase involved in cell wall biosynthesis